MKIFEVIDNRLDSSDEAPFVNDEDNRRFSPAIREKILDAWHTVVSYVQGGGGNMPQLDAAVRILITSFGDRVSYAGDMYRAFGLTAKDLTVPDIRLMSSKLHSWATEFDRQTVSWSTNPNIPVTHLMGQPTMILHQSSSGLDISKLNIEDFSEGEVLSPFSNNVSIYGFAADEKFFPVANFKEFVKYTRSME